MENCLISEIKAEIQFKDIFVVIILKHVLVLEKKLSCKWFHHGNWTISLLIQNVINWFDSFDFEIFALANKLHMYLQMCH